MDLLCLHQTKTAHPKMQNEQGRGDQAGSCLIPWRPHPALPFPDFLPLGSRAAEGQSSAREETQTHGAGQTGVYCGGFQTRQPGGAVEAFGVPSTSVSWAGPSGLGF